MSLQIHCDLWRCCYSRVMTLQCLTMNLWCLYKSTVICDSAATAGSCSYDVSTNPLWFVTVLLQQGHVPMMSLQIHCDLWRCCYSRVMTLQCLMMYLWCLYKSTVICDIAATAGSWHNRTAVVLIGMKLVELGGGGGGGGGWNVVSFDTRFTTNATNTPMVPLGMILIPPW